MKYCNGCAETKSIDNFGKNVSRRDGLQSQCKKCRSKYGKRWYNNNKETHKNKVYKNRLKMRAKTRAYLLEFLDSHPCVDCGERDPIVLHLDHLGDKVFSISKGISQGFTLQRIIAEISKCAVRCANCHARKTAKEVNNFKWQHLTEQDGTVTVAIS